jgi:DNA repair protein RecO (recombination protein O)
MALLVTEAIVLHAFDYLESSRIIRLVSRDAGMRSAIAKGARKSIRRFGGGLDLFAQGTAQLHTKPGRDLDILGAFEDVRPRNALGEDLDRFAGAEAIAEMVILFGRDGADEQLFNATEIAFDTLSQRSGFGATEATLAGAWQIIDALGFGPTLTECAECGSPIGEDAAATFSQAAGGVLCKRCKHLNAGGRMLPPTARHAIAGWIAGSHTTISETDARAHQRLLREFLTYHLHDGRTMRAFDMWGAVAPVA